MILKEKDICCDCAQESALGSGLHSRLLTAIVIYTAHSNLFSEPLKEIKQGIKNDVLYTYAFSSPKKGILAEFDIVKPLLGLSEEEALIYEKKRPTSKKPLSQDFTTTAVNTRK